MSVKDPNGMEIERLEQQEELRYHFSAWTGGNYEFCIKTMNPKEAVDCIFSIQSGVQATDYSNIVTKKHLRPVELQA